MLKLNAMLTPLIDPFNLRCSLICNAADNTLIALEGEVILLAAGMGMTHAANDAVFEIRRAG